MLFVFVLFCKCKGRLTLSNCVGLQLIFGKKFLNLICLFLIFNFNRNTTIFIRYGIGNNLGLTTKILCA